MTRGAIIICLALAVWLGGMGSALAQDQAAAIEELKKEMKELHQEVSAKDKKIVDRVTLIFRPSKDNIRPKRDCLKKFSEKKSAQSDKVS